MPYLSRCDGTADAAAGVLSQVVRDFIWGGDVSKAEEGQSCKDCIIMYITNCEQKGTQTRCPKCSKGPFKVIGVGSYQSRVLITARRRTS